MKQILAMLVFALTFTAAAQTFEYATLTIDLSTIGASPNAILFEDPKDSYNGQSFIVVANKLSPVDPRVTNLGMAGLLNHIGIHGWELRGTMQAESSYTLIFIRAGL